MIRRWLSARPVRFRVAAIFIGVALISGLAIAFLISQNQVQDQSWSQIQQSGTLRVAMDASYPPFETIDQATGQPVGLDVDLAHEIGRRLGVEIAITNIAYDGLYDALLTRKADVLISALADLPQAQGKASFTLPYFNAGEILVVKRGSGITSMEALSDRSVGVEYGSGGDVEARKWQRRLRNLTLKRYPDPDSALKAVSSGEVDAAIVDGIAARLAVGKDASLALGPHLVDTLFGVALGSDDEILHEKLDEAIQQMMSDGTVNRLIEKWFDPQRTVP